VSFLNLIAPVGHSNSQALQAVHWDATILKAIGFLLLIEMG